MELDALLEDWNAAYPFHAFIRDGIVDAGSYEKPQILFVLREMNCAEPRDLRADLRRDGSGWKTWNNVARWTKALLDGDEDYPERMSAQERAEQLRRVAVLNLKKEGGSSRTDGAELERAVQQQSTWIGAEITLCDPALIICCGLPSAGMMGNAALLKEAVFSDSTSWSSFSSGKMGREWWYYTAQINGRQVPVISFCHPQVTVLGDRRGHRELFEPLYREMLGIRERFLDAVADRHGVDAAES